MFKLGALLLVVFLIAFTMGAWARKNYKEKDAPSRGWIVRFFFGCFSVALGGVITAILIRIGIDSGVLTAENIPAALLFLPFMPLVAGWWVSLRLERGMLKDMNDQVD